jgi:hypothetical protein
MPVTLVTEINITLNDIIGYEPAVGMRWDVFTRLEKVGVLTGTGQSTTLAACV